MRTPLFIAGFVSFLVCATASFASEAAYEQRLARGIVSVEIGDYPAAEGEFRAALLEKPGDPAATLYLGITLSRAGKAEAEAVLKNALAAAPEDPRANYELGVYYYNRGNFPAARACFEKTVSLAPDTRVSRSALKYVEAIPGGGVARRWGLDLSGGIQYDSNVVLAPNNMPLPQGITGQSDWREVFLVRGRYALISGEKGDLSIGDRFYQSFNNKLNDFNMTQNIADLSGGFRLSPALMIRGTYSFEVDYLGGDRYAYVNLLSPFLVISEGAGLSTTLEYKWRADHFFNGQMFDNNSDRTGTYQSLGITQDIPVAKGVTAKAGYAHEWDNAQTDWWSYKGDLGFAEISCELPRRTFLDLKGDYHDNRYDGVYPGYGIARKDTIWNGSIVVGIHLSDRYTIFAGYAYTDESSNITAFSYTRSVTSVFLNARF